LECPDLSAPKRRKLQDSERKDVVDERQFKAKGLG